MGSNNVNRLGSKHDEMADAAAATVLARHSRSDELRYIADRKKIRKLRVSRLKGDNPPFWVEEGPRLGCKIDSRIDQRLLGTTI